MEHHKPPDNPLIEEVLTDTAEHFFGSRSEIESMIDRFHDYTQRLKRKEAQLSVSAGFLNYLLINRDIAELFYKTIRIESPSHFLDFPRSIEYIPEKIPFSFTAKWEYIRLVIWAYTELHKAGESYLKGSEAEDTQKTSTDEKNVYYQLVKNMCDLINEKINELNKDMSPTALLQFVRQFNTEIECREHIAVPGYCGESGGIDEKLAFKPIDFCSLQIRQYPEIPVRDQIITEITSFCKRIYSQNKPQIQHLIFEIRKEIERRVKERISIDSQDLKE